MVPLQPYESMTMKLLCSLRIPVVVIATMTLLVACSPKFDWREVRPENAGYMVALPAKPSSFSRKIDLNGTPVVMTMTASDIDGVTFAVGTAELPDAMQAQVSLAAMKTAMVNNIAGTIKLEKVLTIPQSPHGGTLAVTEIEATGRTATGEARLLHARFLAKEKRVYQLVALGTDQSLSREQVNNFFSSFKLN